jgi:UDP-glucuronate 4-epimerase
LKVDRIKTRILVTGAAGFIGASLMSKLVSKFPNTIGVDNFSEYYDSRLKKHHIKTLGLEDRISTIDICDLAALTETYSQTKPDVVVHLAAQGGVRASQIDPRPYIETNQLGFLNLLELNNKFGVEKFIYASSSSVYGEGLPVPFKEEMQLPGPKSLYAASKISNEIMAMYFPRQSNQARIGLRFFTVYGPWGRPDMAVSRLLASGYKRRPFVLTANLDLIRDFTYVEDVTAAIEDLIRADMTHLDSHTLLNVAGEAPRTMGELIEICESTGVPINIQKGEINRLDVSKTHGSSEKLAGLGVRTPRTNLEIGIQKTAKWMFDVSQSGLVEFLD